MSTPLVDLGAVPASGVAAPGVVLAQDPAPPPGEGPEFGKASPVALVVIVLLGIATVFLIRSMTKHLRRVPASFDDPAESSGDETEPVGDGGPERAPGGGVEDRQPAESSNGDKPDPPGPSSA
jgi:hypothetical protein